MVLYLVYHMMEMINNISSANTGIDSLVITETIFKSFFIIKVISIPTE